jgi:general nucleoside transport system permease protein
MSEKATPPPPASSPEVIPSVAARLAFYQRAGGVLTPLLTAVVAFFIGGLVILATQHKNPLSTYKAIFDGTGLNWFFHVGSYKVGLPFTTAKVWFPWDTGSTAAMNLQQTLLNATPLILTGLAVAFAFRCGLFNIGGTGQYMVGMIVAVELGILMPGLSGPLHVLIALAGATLAGALWGGIAGFLKATTGAHEVITTIMLNWIAFWGASYLVGFNGPLQNPSQISAPVTRRIADSAHLKVFWGFPTLQGLTIGFLIAIGALVVYWLILSRTTLGYEVKAVGFNPEAARYGGISVAKNFFLAMAISGAFAGLAGAIDLLGWQFNVDQTTLQSLAVGGVAFIGIAVALLGRNNPVGIFFSALLFGALLTGTSTRNLDPTVFQPELATNLTRIIQGLVVLFVGADLLVIYAWRLAKKARLRKREALGQQETAA